MPERGEHTYSEIMSQPAVWVDALSAFSAESKALTKLWKDQPVDQVIFTGCGSTYYLSLVGAALFQGLTGVPCVARPGSEMALFPDLVYPKDKRTLLVPVSRSGETTETVDAVAVFREVVGGPIVAITCYGSSSLAAQADVVLAAEAAQEASIAQTRSFTCMTVLAEALAYHFSEGDASRVLAPLPTIADRLLDEYHALARELGESGDIERFFFLGSGQLYGIACEAMLKMKEMSLSYSEAFHTLEFRHGPMSMVNSGSLVVGLVSEEVSRHEINVLKHMQGLGGVILAFTETEETDLASGSRTVKLSSGLPSWARPVLYLPVLQLLAYYRAMSRGQNPDRPTNLDTVVHLDSLLEGGS